MQYHSVLGDNRLEKKKEMFATINVYHGVLYIFSNMYVNNIR